MLQNRHQLVFQELFGGVFVLRKHQNQRIWLFQGGFYRFCGRHDRPPILPRFWEKKQLRGVHEGRNRPLFRPQDPRLVFFGVEIVQIAPVFDERL